MHVLYDQGNFPDSCQFEDTDVFWVMILAVLGGLVGGSFNGLVLAGKKMRAALGVAKGGWRLAAEGALVCLVSCPEPRASHLLRLGPGGPSARLWAQVSYAMLCYAILCR
jgi:hypothetical protein